MNFNNNVKELKEKARAEEDLYDNTKYSKPVNSSNGIDNGTGNMVDVPNNNNNNNNN